MFHVHSTDILAFYIITVTPYNEVNVINCNFQGVVLLSQTSFSLEEQIYIWSDTKFTSSSYWVDFIDFA